MKSLLVMRHAKSDWSDGRQEDFDRPLNKRGRKDVRRVGRFLSVCAFPDLVLASAAVRAQETAVRLVKELDDAPQLVLDGRLYLSDPPTLAAVLSSAAGDADTVVVIAHNPGMENWVTQLTGATLHFPTAAVAHVELDIPDWQALDQQQGHLQWLVTPKLLRGAD